MNSRPGRSTEVDDEDGETDEMDDDSARGV